MWWLLPKLSTESLCNIAAAAANVAVLVEHPNGPPGVVEAAPQVEQLDVLRCHARVHDLEQTVAAQAAQIQQLFEEIEMLKARV